MKNIKFRNLSLRIAFIILVSFICVPIPFLEAEGAEKSAQSESEVLLRNYQDYRQRFDSIKEESDIAVCGFRIIKNQVFPVTMQYFGEVSFVPALDGQYNRLALFFVGKDGDIVYKTDQLETNNRNKGELEQPNKGIAAVSFQDMDKDGLTDIALITSCVKDAGTYAGKTYKVGDVLFQNAQGFYRDWRLSDKINRFSMNKGIESITAFIMDGYSTEFLYTATTMGELLAQGFQIIPEQCYWRKFEKMGNLQVVPGTYSMAGYNVFMIFLVNEQGYIVWSFQPMGDYDNLYALKGMTCRDIDGDGLKDIVVLARYSYEGDEGEDIIISDYSIYYQRTAGFYGDTDIKRMYQCSDSDTLGELVEKVRAYWGWGSVEQSTLHTEDIIS